MRLLEPRIAPLLNYLNVLNLSCEIFGKYQFLTGLLGT